MINQVYILELILVYKSFGRLWFQFKIRETIHLSHFVKCRFNKCGSVEFPTEGQSNFQNDDLRNRFSYGKYHCVSVLDRYLAKVRAFPQTWLNFFQKFY